jgi:hypothetical protein
MGHAELVEASEEVVAGEEVVDEPPGEASEQPDPVHALGPAFRVDVVGGQLRGGKDVQPAQLASHPAARLRSPPLARISHTASSRDAARNHARSRSESERSADRRNKVKSTGDRRLAESPEGCPGHQRADRISRRAVPAELHENILSKGNSGRNEAGTNRSKSQQKRYEKCGLARMALG